MFICASLGSVPQTAINCGVGGIVGAVGTTIMVGADVGNLVGTEVSSEFPEAIGLVEGPCVTPQTLAGTLKHASVGPHSAAAPVGQRLLISRQFASDSKEFAPHTLYDEGVGSGVGASVPQRSTATSKQACPKEHEFSSHESFVRQFSTASS